MKPRETDQAVGFNGHVQALDFSSDTALFCSNNVDVLELPHLLTHYIHAQKVLCLHSCAVKHH